SFNSYVSRAASVPPLSTTVYVPGRRKVARRESPTLTLRRRAAALQGRDDPLPDSLVRGVQPLRLDLVDRPAVEQLHDRAEQPGERLVALGAGVAVKAAHALQPVATLVPVAEHDGDGVVPDHAEQHQVGGLAAFGSLRAAERLVHAQFLRGPQQFMMADKRVEPPLVVRLQRRL